MSAVAALIFPVYQTTRSVRYPPCCSDLCVCEPSIFCEFRITFPRALADPSIAVVLAPYIFRTVHCPRPTAGSYAKLRPCPPLLEIGSIEPKPPLPPPLNRSHRRAYGEPIPGHVLAERLGEYLHASIVRWGTRAFPNTLFVASWEEDEEGQEGAEWDSDRKIGEEGVDCVGGTMEASGDEIAAAEVVTEFGGRNGDETEGFPGEEAGEAVAAAHTTAGCGENSDPAKGEGDRGVNDADACELGDGRAGDMITKGLPAGDTKRRRKGCFRLHVVDPSGAARRYRAACTGRGSARTRRWLHRRSSAVVAESSFAPTQAVGGTVTATTAAGAGEGRKWVGQRGAIGKRLRPGDEDEDDEERDGESDSEKGDDNVRGEAAGGGEFTEASQPLHSGRRLLSEMTCAQASRELVRAIKSRDGSSSGNKDGPVGVPEVAWITLVGDAAEFVHNVSVEDVVVVDTERKE